MSSADRETVLFRNREFVKRVGKRADRQARFEGGLGLWVIGPNRIADHHKIRRLMENILRVETFCHRNAPIRQRRAHGGVERAVGSCHA